MATPPRAPRGRRLARSLAGATVALVTIGATAVARADTAPTPTPTPTPPAPNIIPALTGFNQFWIPKARNAHSFAGSVRGPQTLAHNDELAVWINNHATSAQRFRAIQDNQYNDKTRSSYDESITSSTALGSVLRPIYVRGIESGALPLTEKLLNVSNGGTAGTFVGTGAAKPYFDYPRPFLPVTPGAPVPSGAVAGCDTTTYNAASLKSIRAGQPYADATGNLNIKQVPDTVDRSHLFSPHDVKLSVGYAGLCSGGAFPSGHTTNAYESGIMLATLLPQLAPEILARVSEQGNDRIVLGVHYPLDIIGGRIDGELAESTLWADRDFRQQVIDPAREELNNYLKNSCGGTIVSCYNRGKPYQDNPYDGAALPGGTSQIVTDRASAVTVYDERLTYGFTPTNTTGLDPSVPSNAAFLLTSAFPDLTKAQRTQVLAQTEIGSGYPLDQTRTGAAWQRLDLAKAMTATVNVDQTGEVTVTATGGLPQVTGPGVTPYVAGSARR